NRDTRHIGMAPGVMRVVGRSWANKTNHTLTTNVSHGPGAFGWLKLCDVVHVGRIHGAARRIEHLRVTVAEQNFTTEAKRVQKLVLDGANYGSVLAIG